MIADARSPFLEAFRMARRSETSVSLSAFCVPARRSASFSMLSIASRLDIDTSGIMTLASEELWDGTRNPYCRWHHVGDGLLNRPPTEPRTGFSLFAGEGATPRTGRRVQPLLSCYVIVVNPLPFLLIPATRSAGAENGHFGRGVVGPIGDKRDVERKPTQSEPRQQSNGMSRLSPGGSS